MAADGCCIICRTKKIHPAQAALSGVDVDIPTPVTIDRDVLLPGEASALLFAKRVPFARGQSLSAPIDVPEPRGRDRMRRIVAASHQHGAVCATMVLYRRQGHVVTAGVRPRHLAWRLLIRMSWLFRPMPVG